jgi:hypothetical protein
MNGGTLGMADLTPADFLPCDAAEGQEPVYDGGCAGTGEVPHVRQVQSLPDMIRIRDSKGTFMGVYGLNAGTDSYKPVKMFLPS